ncbi:MAG: hypothetical protein WDM90_13830 [Ferruginibacter sp.]
MKKYILLIATTIAFAKASTAQSYLGYRSSNYNGVNGVFFNPANIADSVINSTLTLLA